MPYCNQCQLIHGEEHRFCQRCGQLLKGSPSTAARPCARCGTLIWPGQKFCTECGLPLRVARVNQEEEEAPSRPPLFYPRRPETMARRRQRRPGRFLSLIALALLVVGGIYLWRHLPSRVAIDRVETKTAPQDDLRSEVEKIAGKDPLRPSQQGYQQVAQLLPLLLSQSGAAREPISSSCGKTMI